MACLGRRLKTDSPQGRQHGTDQDILATERFVAFFPIPLDGPCVERSLDAPLAKQGIDQPKHSTKGTEQPSWPKHAGRFEPFHAGRFESFLQRADYV
jgi:hypothetical protein